ncbi:MAG: DUF3421 domain-containing protein [Rhodospirillales bacterium]
MNRKAFGVVMVIAAAVALSAGSSGPVMAQNTLPTAGAQKWVAAKDGQVPPGAVVGGQHGGKPFYVCRSKVGKGGIQLAEGKLINGYCDIVWGLYPNRHTTYEVLVRAAPTVVSPALQPAAGATLRWVAASGGQVPPGAIVGGMEPARKLFVCRARYGQGGNIGDHPGKIVAGNCNIGWGGREILLPRYEVLTGNAAHVAWIPVIQGKMPGNAYVGGSEAARKLFVCRARFGQGGNVGIHPGKAVDGRCHIGWGGREIPLPVFEVMVAR